ncbi:hypothetical protein J6590_082894 [Homalodisca vitripennis]|nr:hypothetical protein J6590_082894 [Homalodisca vitripennis]
MLAERNEEDMEEALNAVGNGMSVNQNSSSSYILLRDVDESTTLLERPRMKMNEEGSASAVPVGGTGLPEPLATLLGSRAACQAGPGAVCPNGLLQGQHTAGRPSNTNPPGTGDQGPGEVRYLPESCYAMCQVSPPRSADRAAGSQHRTAAQASTIIPPGTCQGPGEVRTTPESCQGAATKCQGNLRRSEAQKGLSKGHPTTPGISTPVAQAMEPATLGPTL